jgi:hypothetical protein
MEEPLQSPRQSQYQILQVFVQLKVWAALVVKLPANKTIIARTKPKSKFLIFIVGPLFEKQANHILKIFLTRLRITNLPVLVSY